MRTTNFPAYAFAAAILLLPAGFLMAQSPLGGYPDSIPNPSRETLYTARQDMMPVAPQATGSAYASPEANPVEAIPEKPKSSFSSFFSKMLGPAKSDPMQYQRKQEARFQTSVDPPQSETPKPSRSILEPPASRQAPIQPPQAARYRDPDAPPAPRTNPERSIAEQSKATSKAPTKTKPGEDDGQDQIEALLQEESFSEKDYIGSAVREKSTSAKDLYDRGMQTEAGGNFTEAVRHYNGFIRANKRQTSNGTLAAPYHRLALISWKTQKAKEADIYFRYAIKYARGGNIPIIAGDYGLFLMDRDKLPQAEAVLRNGLIQSPENKRLLLYLGRCTARQNKPIESLRYLETAVGEERAYWEVASVYRERGDFESARHMDLKREEFLARKARPAYGSERQYAGRSIPASPLAPPPVLAAPRGQTAGSAIPFPTFDDPLGIPSMAQPTTAAPAVTVLPPGGWNAAAPEQAEPAVPIAPNSNVYHYPDGATIPVAYPFSVPVPVEPDPNALPPMTSESEPVGRVGMNSEALW